MQSSTVTIFLLDDEPEVTVAITWFLESMKFDVKAYNTATEFFKNFAAHTGPACLVLDLLMPEQNGIDVLKVVTQIRPDVPTIFLSGHGDIPSAIRAMKLGAIDFLQKPFDPQIFLGVVNQGIRVSRERYRDFEKIRATNKIFSRLSPREQQILAHATDGNSSKEIAAIFGISYKTVDVHRASILRKLEIPTFKELIRLTRKLGVLSDLSVAPVGDRQCQRPHAVAPIASAATR